MSKQTYELTAAIYGGPKVLKAGDTVELDPKLRDDSAFWRTRTKPVKGELTPATPAADSKADTSTGKQTAGRSK